MQNINLLQPPCSGASRLKETKKFQPWVQLTPTFDLSGVMDEVEPGSNGHALVNQQFTSTPEGCCQGHGNTGSPKFPGKCHTPDVTRFPAAQGDVNNHVPPGKSYIQGNPALTNTSTFPAATGHSVAVNEPYQTSTQSPDSSKTGSSYRMHTAAIQRPDSGPMEASTITTGSTANTSTGAANHGFTTAQAGSPHQVSSATKGARYDETDGGVDDRTGMQKLADKLSPGSAIGKHTSDVAGWAPNAGPSHGYDTGDGPTRFTAGHVASDYEGDVSNSRNDITGPTADAATVTADKGNGLPFEKPPHYITNEFGDVVDIDPVGTGSSTSGCTHRTSHAQQAGVATTGHSSAHTSPRSDCHQSHGKGNAAHDVGSGRGTSCAGSTSEGKHANVAPNTGIGGADAFSGDGPRYITNEYGGVLGTEPHAAV
ncbi:TPA: hypothetical protein ACH3X2_001330 [Trebouxia sp. C0005]